MDMSIEAGNQDAWSRTLCKLLSLPGASVGGPDL
jgi:hypothetical protein